MALGTTFLEIYHSERDYGLLQESVVVHPATPNVEIIPIGGADGYIDLSDEPVGYTTYSQREIDWVFSIPDGADWQTIREKVANQLHGLPGHIILDEDPDYFYKGRVIVQKYALDGCLRKITMKAICDPYKYKQKETVVKVTTGPDWKTVALRNAKKPLCPYIETDGYIDVEVKGKTYLYGPGSEQLPELILYYGTQYIRVRNSESVTTPHDVTVRYREAIL